MNLGRFGCFLLTLVVTDSDCFSFPDSCGLFSTDSYTACCGQGWRATSVKVLFDPFTGEPIKKDK